MVLLPKGANTAISGSSLQVRLSWSIAQGAPAIDLSALLLHGAGKVRNDDDFVFFNQPQHASGAVMLGSRTGSSADLTVDLAVIEPEVDRVVVAASVDDATFGEVRDLVLTILDRTAGTEIARFSDMGATSETALVGGELYRRAGAWKFRAVGQGWASGLAGLASDYGITVEEEAGDSSDAGGDDPAPPDAALRSVPASAAVPPSTLVELARGLRARLAGSPPAPSRAEAPSNVEATRTDPIPVPRRSSVRPVLYRPPGNLWPSVEVVGESHYKAALQKVLGRLRVFEDREVEVEAKLVPEPQNRHDRNAVAVQIDDAVVGYLSRDDALAWRPVLARLQAADAILSPRARVWGRNGGPDGGGFLGSVRVALPQPGQTLPLNAPPSSSYSVIPWGDRLKLTGEPWHLNPLARYLGAQHDGLLLVTLGVRTEKLQRGSDRIIVDAFVDETAVASLTPASSKNIAPLVGHLDSRGLVATGWATIRGSSLAIELGLQTARAHDVPEEWARAEPATIPERAFGST